MANKPFRPVNFPAPKGKAPKAYRAGSKGDRLVKALARKNGASPEELMREMSKAGGAPVTLDGPNPLRPWLSPDYLQRNGYGIRSEVSATGKVRMYLVVNKGMALDTSRSDVSKSNDATRKRSQRKVRQDKPQDAAPTTAPESGDSEAA